MPTSSPISSLYPEWVSEYTETEVLEADAEGYPKVARLVLEAAVLRDTMVLKYDWAPDRESVRWSMVSSTLLKALGSAYRLTRTEPAPMSPTNCRWTCWCR